MLLGSEHPRERKPRASGDDPPVAEDELGVLQ